MGLRSRPYVRKSDVGQVLQKVSCGIDKVGKKTSPMELPSRRKHVSLKA